VNTCITSGRPADGERPAGTYARDMLGRLLIRLVVGIEPLEGNNLYPPRHAESDRLGQAAAGKDRREAQMILNHKATIELLWNKPEDIASKRFTFFNLHAFAAENLLADPQRAGGCAVVSSKLAGTVFHPLGDPHNAYFQMILAKAGRHRRPFEAGLFSSWVHIPYLQPFVDVNKRVSRLGANIPLIRRNLCPLSFIDVPERAYVEGTLVCMS